MNSRLPELLLQAEVERSVRAITTSRQMRNMRENLIQIVSRASLLQTMTAESYLMADEIVERTTPAR
jgi:predicted methyltransferase MtxX (methanogen marker protein 4)